MKLVTRLVLAGALAAAATGFVAPASANDCSDPKRPCRPCWVNLDATDPRYIVRCSPA